MMSDFLSASLTFQQKALLDDLILDECASKECYENQVMQTCTSWVSVGNIHINTLSKIGASTTPFLGVMLYV